MSNPITIVADLLALFPKATVTGALDAAIRRPVPADGVLKDALFAHPLSEATAARVAYTLTLLPVQGDERLYLTFDTALSDGIPPAERPKSDGVVFRVEIGGHSLFSHRQTESRWTPGGADLTPWAGKTVTVTLVTEAGATLAYDWALWGQPRVVRLGGVATTTRCGIAALQLRGPARVTITPTGGGEPISVKSQGVVVLPFAFPTAHGVELSVSPAEALLPGSLRLAPFAPEVTVTQLGPTVPVPLAGQVLTLRVELQNRGEGWLPPQRERVSPTVAGKALPAQPVPALAPGERHWLEWRWKAPVKPTELTLACRGRQTTFRTVCATRTRTLKNPWLTVEVFEDRFARVFYKGKPVGTLSPLAADLTLTLEPDRPWLRLRGSVLPTLHAGDSQAHAGALFPGVEQLSPGEPSSNLRGFAPPLHLRQRPPATFLTAPLVAVSLGPKAVAPLLNPPPGACPDSLGTPPVPQSTILTVGLFGKAGSRATFAVPAGIQECHTLQLDGTEATLFVTEEGPLSGLREWLRDSRGLPLVPRRPDEADLARCRKGFETLWVGEKRQWKPIREGAPEPNAGIAALVWWDGLTQGNQAGLRRAQEAVSALAPAHYAQRGACHLMRFELPFLAGKLPEAFAGLRRELESLMASQASDGGWRFGATEGPQRTLGQAGDSVSGISSHAAWMLMRWARISGDPVARAAGERALAFVARFDLPRGASLWECPIYEPDVLASVWLLAANLEGWAATHHTRWLSEALRWAERAVPFVYLWGRRERPAQLGACIATLGTTFYLHSWLGRPVQWEGLILAWHLRRLADALEAAPLAPGVLRFTPQDWRHLAGLLLASGLHQQCDDGTYPDSITDFKDPQPVFINPENLFALLLDEKGKAPELQTVLWRGLRLTSLARFESVGAKLRLHFFPGATAHVLVSGPDVALRAGGKPVLVQPVRSFARTFALTFDTPTLDLERDE